MNFSRVDPVQYCLGGLPTPRCVRLLSRARIWPIAVSLLTVVIVSSQAQSQNLQDSGLELPGVWAGQAGWGDYDSDGDMDLALIGEVVADDGQCERIARVLRNDGALLAEDVTQSQRLTGVYFGDLGWADYDSDGDLDLAIAGWDDDGEESMRLYLNEEGTEPADRLLSFDISQVDGDGNSNFKGVRYAALSWVDYDTDGDLDLVVSGMEEIGTSLTHVYRNEDGALRLDELNSEAIINVHGGDLAWADYDSDGDLDLAISGENVIADGGIRRVTEFYVNDPLGTLTLDSGISLPFDSLVKGGSLAWSDYDSDGNPDLAISGHDEVWNRALQLYRNRPAGTFNRDTDFSLNAFQTVGGQLDWVDFDNDGDPDLAVSGRTIVSDYEAHVFENRNGSVTGVSIEQNLEGLAGGLALWADYDDDGRVDLVTSGVDESGESRTILYSNLGVTTINTAPNPPASLNPVEVTSTRALFSWSPGSDGESDAISYNIRIGTEAGAGDIVSASLSVGQGNAGFETSYVLSRSLAPDTYVWSVQSVDGTFTRSAFSQEDPFVVTRFVSSDQRIRDLRESAMSWGDYDDDGDIDLAIMGLNRSGEAQSLLYVNRGSTLTLVDADIVSLQEGDLAWGDYDGDGDLDLFITGEDAIGNRANFLYRTDTSGGTDNAGIAVAIRFRPDLSESSVDWGDVDNDGDLDFVLMGQSGATEAGAQLSFTEIWANDGAGDFDTLGVNLTGLNNGESVFGDVDGDGDLDLAVTGVSSDGVRDFTVYRNDLASGSVSFADTGNDLPGMESSDLAFGDYDRDGDLDLAAGGVTASDGPSTAIYANDGTGTYAEIGDVDLPGIQGGDLAWGDYDNDQDLDLVMVGNIGQQQKIFRVYENTIGQAAPDSAFALDAIPILRGVDFSAVTLADADGDGDLDLFSSGSGTTTSTAVNDNLTAQQLNSNVPPSAPSGLRAEDAGDEVTLSWLPASDDGAPPVESLTYNLRLGRTSEGDSVISGQLPLGPGNAGHNLVRSVGELVSGTYFWSVQTVDVGYSRSDWSAESQFIVDVIPPTIDRLTLNKSKSESDTTNFGIDQTVTVALEFLDEHSGVEKDVEPLVEATIDGQPFQFRTVRYTGLTWTGELTVAESMPSGTASVSVRGLEDIKGNTLVPFDSTGVFSVDTQLPAVSSTAPGFAAVGVPDSTTRLRITFSEPIDQQTVIADNFQITAGNSPVALADAPLYSADDNTVVLAPAGGLLPGTQYSVEVSAAVEDLAGNRPANAISWNFSTNVPQLVSTEPADGTASVAIDDGRISATFDGGLIESLLEDADAVQVRREGDPVVVADALFVGTSNTLSIDLGEALKPGSRYDVTISGSLAGPLRSVAEGDFTWSFSTAVPQVTTRTPDDGDAAVSAADPSISIGFDGLLDEEAVSGSATLLKQGRAIDATEEEYNPTTGVLSFQPAEGLRPGAQYQVVVSGVVGGPLRQAVGDYSWSFSTAVPQVTTRNPDDGDVEVSAADPSISIEFDGLLDRETVAGSVTLLKQGSAIATTEEEYNETTGALTFQPAEGLRVGTQYQVVVSGVVGGPLRQAVGDYSWSFSTAVPSRVSVLPTEGADDVTIDLEEAVIEFSVPLDEDQLSAGNFSLAREGVPLELRADDPTDRGEGRYGFAPATGWQVGSGYVVQINSSVSGPLGAGQPISWSFQTAIPDTVSVAPAAADSAVSALEGTIAAVFDTDIDDAELAENVRLLGEGQSVQITAPVFDGEAGTLSFGPAAGRLRGGTSYQVVITRSVAGPRATDDFRWGFATRVAEVVSTEPESGSEVTAGPRRVRLSFSDPLDEDLINSQNVTVTRGGAALSLPEDEFLYDQEQFIISLPQIDLIPGSAYEVVVSARLGGPRASTDTRLGFATLVPSVVSTSPTDGTSIAAGARRVEIVFSAALQRDLVNSQNIRLSRGGDPIALEDGEFIYVDETFTASLPEVDFVSGSSYEVVVSSRLGGALANRPDDQFTFLTDLPTLVEANPPFGAEGVSVTSPPVRIVFSGPVATADQSGFQLRARRIVDLQEDPDAPFELTPITGFGFEDPAQTIVNFAPQGGFRPFTEYELVIDRSVLGERAETGFDGTFQTAGELPDAAAGGTVTNAEGSVELYFPPNALPSDIGKVEVIIRPAADQPAGKTVSTAAAPAQEPVFVGRAWEIDIGASTLRKPVTLTFHYDSGDLGAQSASQLGVFKLSSGQWTRVGGTPDPSRSQVATTVKELSTFGLFVDPQAAVGTAKIRDLDCRPRAFSPAGGLRATTDVSFDLSSPADVTVRVYNASGRLERVIRHDLPLGQGSQTISWNGRDEDGGVVASGLYIVVVTASGEQAEKVVAVVR